MDSCLQELWSRFCESESDPQAKRIKLTPLTPFEGMGSCPLFNDMVYTGSFEKGVAHGDGIVRASDGSFKYEGSFVNGEKHGTCRMSYVIPKSHFSYSHPVSDLFDRIEMEGCFTKDKLDEQMVFRLFREDGVDGTLRMTSYVASEKVYQGRLDVSNGCFLEGKFCLGLEKEKLTICYRSGVISYSNGDRMEIGGIGDKMVFHCCRQNKRYEGYCSYKNSEKSFIMTNAEDGNGKPMKRKKIAYPF